MARIFFYIFDKLYIKIFQRIENTYWAAVYRQYRFIYDIHPTFKFNGNGIIFYGGGQIKAGEKSYIGRYSTVQSTPGCKVEIGKNCSISHWVNIYTSNRLADQYFYEMMTPKIKSGDVIIEDNCFVGIKTSIIGPVVIGENSVIGANSLVNNNIPPHSIAIGVPAQVVKFKSYLGKNEAQELAEKFKDILTKDLRDFYGV